MHILYTAVTKQSFAHVGVLSILLESNVSGKPGLLAKNYSELF